MGQRIPSNKMFGPSRTIDEWIRERYIPEALMKSSDHGLTITALTKTSKPMRKVLKIIKSQQQLELEVQSEMAGLCPDTVLAIESSFVDGTCGYVMVMEHWGFPFMPGTLRERDDVVIGSSESQTGLPKSAMNDMFGYIECYGKLKEAVAIKIMYKVVSALSVLHSMGYEFNDLKDENILVNETLDEIKVIDFGSVTSLKSWDKTRFRGTLSHAPPEVYFNELTRMPKAQDVWCIGRLMYLMVTGREPLKSRSLGNQWNQWNQWSEATVINEKDLKEVSPGVREFIQGCLRVDPEMRYKMDDVLASPIWTYGTGSSHYLYPR